jgi:hypothetical protein
MVYFYSYFSPLLNEGLSLFTEILFYQVSFLYLDFGNKTGNRENDGDTREWIRVRIRKER